MILEWDLDMRYEGEPSRTWSDDIWDFVITVTGDGNTNMIPLINNLGFSRRT